MSSFFGTDGIRGKTSLDDIDEEEAIRWLEEKRTLTPSFVRVLGEALSHCQPGMAGEGATVVIGWDQRPHNAALVDALTLGLRLTGSRVIHVGECATPSLHHAVLAFEARMGCMITANMVVRMLHVVQTFNISLLLHLRISRLSTVSLLF